jgi:CheY-like chemotaxis protein
LGLSISKAFVKMLGGKIWLDSELDMGSTFYFTLPYKPFKQVELAEQSEEAIAVNLKGKLILLAEDEYANYLYVNDVIEDTGAKLIYAKNGREAVDLFRNNPEIELIIMDIKMPEMDGIAATQTIRGSGAKVPIIALTAYALSGDKERCLEAGCNSYLSKPILRADLLREMEKLLKL